MKEKIIRIGKRTIVGTGMEVEHRLLNCSVWNFNKEDITPVELLHIPYFFPNVIETARFTENEAEMSVLESSFELFNKAFMFCIENFLTEKERLLFRFGLIPEKLSVIWSFGVNDNLPLEEKFTAFYSKKINRLLKVKELRQMFLEEEIHKDKFVNGEPEDTVKLLKRIDCRIIPIVESLNYDEIIPESKFSDKGGFG